MEKKGVLSVDFLVGIILLIVGFIIVLIFFFNIGGTRQIDDTVCQESVIYRATLPGLTKDFVPLKCQTEKICITSKIFQKGDCDEFKGEKGVRTVRIKKGELGEKQIAQLYANEIFDCWSMMGEGSVSLFHSSVAESLGATEVYSSCVICSRIDFDMNSLRAANVDPNNADIRGYMMTNKVPGKDFTYFEYMGLASGKFSVEDLLDSSGKTPQQIEDQINSVDMLESEKQSALELLKTVEEVQLNSEIKSTLVEDNIDFNKNSTAVLFMQITAPKHGETSANFLAILASSFGVSLKYAPGTFFTWPKKFVSVSPAVSPLGSAWPEYNSYSIKKIGKFGVKAAALKVAAAAVVVAYGAQQANVYYQRGLTATKCQDVSAGEQARDGCSVVRAVPYEPDMISSYCNIIESIP